jgi:hypothetical protein
MQLVGSGNQAKRHPLFTADGSVTTGGTPQLILPETPSRSFLMLQNVSAGPLWFEFGSARATPAAAIRETRLSSVSISRAATGPTRRSSPGESRAPTA